MMNTETENSIFLSHAAAVHQMLLKGESQTRDLLFIGGAALAPWLAGLLGEHINAHVPFWVGAAAVLASAGVLFATRPHLAHIDDDEPALDELTDQARAVTVGSDS